MENTNIENIQTQVLIRTVSSEEREFISSEEENISEISQRTLTEGGNDLPIMFSDSNDARFVDEINNNIDLQESRTVILQNIVQNRYNIEFFDLIGQNPNAITHITEITQYPISVENYYHLNNILILASPSYSNVNEIVVALLGNMPLSTDNLIDPISIIDSSADDAYEALNESRVVAENARVLADEEARDNMAAATGAGSFNYRGLFRWGAGLALTGLSTYYLGPQAGPLLSGSLRILQQLQDSSTSINNSLFSSEDSSESTGIRDIAHVIYCWFRDFTRDIANGRQR
jgi:hypothetical protein